MLPYVAAFMLGEEPDAGAALRRALKTDAPARALAALAARLGAPTSLAELGVSEDDLDVVVEQVVGNVYGGRVVTGEALRSLLLAALHGDVESQA
jgi:maleylacetate reductase